MNFGKTLNAASDKLATTIAKTGSLVSLLDDLSQKGWEARLTSKAKANTVQAITIVSAVRLVTIPIALRRNRPIGSMPILKGASYTPLGRKLLLVSAGMNTLAVAAGAYELWRQSRQEQTSRLYNTTPPNDML